MDRRLKKAGYEVEIYASAQHLLDHLPSESVPSCILLDVKIPGLDGPALQTRLCELGSTLPIIFLTGYPDIPTAVHAVKGGADDFLAKPVRSDDLLRAIERALARHQTSRDLHDKLEVVRARIGTLTTRQRQVRTKRQLTAYYHKHCMRNRHVIRIDILLGLLPIRGHHSAGNDRPDAVDARQPFATGVLAQKHLDLAR